MIQCDSVWVVLVIFGLYLRCSLIYFWYFGVVVEGLFSDCFCVLLGWFFFVYNLLLIEVMLYEYIGVLCYYVYNVMGWNEEFIKLDCVMFVVIIYVLLYLFCLVFLLVLGVCNQVLLLVVSVVLLCVFFCLLLVV